MAKKTVPSSVPPGAHELVKICFERIIPHDLDPEYPVRKVLREHMAAGEGRQLDAGEMAHFARMAVVNSKKWQPGMSLKCRFLDGSKKMKKKVEEVAHGWEQYCNIKLKFVTSGKAEIRISFYADSGSWSAVGRDALNKQYFPAHQPTMNYGWLRDETLDDEYSRVALHEFGHALGCVHEHQSPTFARKWNTAAVMKYFQGPPNYWSPDDIKQNVLEKYSPQGISATKYDPKSIMLYSFDAALFSDGLGPTNENKSASANDIKMIKAMYP
jgi:hypothetical protein